jgi:tRNA threonylcarbamoyladenosine biosynthesis protein TsaE
LDQFNIVCRGLADTGSVADAVARQLRRGDAIMLDGKLAAGKTHFVKALARALGSADAVTSPTYAIAHFYDTAMGKLLHIDAYRLSGAAEFRDLGLDGYFADGVTVVEWGHIVAEEFADRLSIAFDFADGDDARRTLTFSSAGERWRPVMAVLQREIAERLA